ncbi:MAG: DUF4136 domain-containing protein [bacterium]
MSACLAVILAGCATPAYINTKATSQVITEEAIVNRMGWNNWGFYSDNNLPAVAKPAEAINVRVYRDAEKSLADYKTFGFDYTDKTNPLLEKELFRQLEKILESYGLTRVKENPEILISMNFFIGKKEQYTPPTTVTSTELKSVWNTGMIGWNMMGYSSEVPVTTSTTTPGHTDISYYSNIRLNFLDYANLMAPERPEVPPFIWLAEAEHKGIDPDIRGVSVVMFDGLMKVIADKSSKGATYFTCHFVYGRLGLGFDGADLRIVRYVEPGSVAAKHGIKQGDMILRINGKSAKALGAVIYPPSNSNNPYLLDVLGSRGDSEVELVIRSAETRKDITLRMRPRFEDKYLYVDAYGSLLQKTK